MIRQLGEGVEGPLGLHEGDAIDRAQTVAQQGSALVVTGGHGPDAVAGALQRGQSAPLGKAADIAGALALQGSSGLDHGCRAGQIPKPPARHGPALGKAVHGEATVAKILGNGGEAVVDLSFRQQVLIDLVAHHQHAGVTTQQLSQGFEFVEAGNAASGISRTVEHQQPGLRRDAPFQSVEIQREPG